MAEPAPTLAAGPAGPAGTAGPGSSAGPRSSAGPGSSAGPASTAGAAGSVGTVETQYLDLPGPVRLDCGRDLYPVRVAYETYGTLSPRRDNVILVCHALSGDAHAAGLALTPPARGA